MALIDQTYFIGTINIPNTDRIDVQESLSWFIDKYEPEMLREAMGYDLYKAFISGLPTSTIGDRWDDLKSGKEYTDINGKNRKWDGLVEAVSEENPFNKRSIIAAYVYYFWMRDQATQTTGVGEALAKTENAVRVSPINKMVHAWNEAAKGVQELICFLEANKDVYTEWDSTTARKTLRYFHPINAFGI